jgi:UDP-GlcNAc:undecaprenyl-phosphate/decaprenyl-phosphate GlcNAc-1-phosphate transferase
VTHDQALFAVVAGVAAFVLSLAGVPLSRVLARRWGVLDPPGPRKIHAAPMPRMGGLGVFLAFTVVVLTGYLMLPVLRGSALAPAFASALELLGQARRVETKLLAVLGGSAIAFAVGLLDDILGPRMPFWAKGVGQVVAAGVLIAADVKTSFLPQEWMNVVLTLFWLVGITNAFNLLDNMDGLSSGVALVASSVLLLNAWLLGEFFISLLLVAFMGSLLGFLRFNFHPASVFLGDCGSLFIGFLLGSLTLLERYVSTASSTLFPVLMPVLVLAIPVLDTATVVAIRLREHRPIYVGDTRHLSHRLVSLGLSPRAAVLFIYLATFCLGLGAALLPHASPLQTWMIVCQSLCFVALFMCLLFFERRRIPR